MPHGLMKQGGKGMRRRCEFPQWVRIPGLPEAQSHWIRVLPPLMTGLCQEIKVMLYVFYKVIERSSQNAGTVF